MSANERVFWKLFIINGRMALRAAVKGIDYYRAREYQLLLEMMERRNSSSEDKKVLDLACGEEVLPIFLSNRTGRPIHACDLDMRKLSLQARFCRRLRNHGGHINLTQADALRTGYKDGSFDIVINLAVISLFDREDSVCLVREIARIMRQHGMAYLSIGYSQSAGEQYDVSAGGYFLRYDDAALTKHIIEPSGLIEVERKYFGEPSFQFGRRWYRLPFWIRIFFRWASPFLTLLFCKELPGSQRTHATGVLLALRKPPEHQAK
jgi:SAM-dependent methyltransferase